MKNCGKKEQIRGSLIKKVLRKCLKIIKNKL